AMSVQEIAFGFLSVAVEKMANAIKQVSTQKGYDPADYVLYCFGGAGGQHACLIAESLGINRILIHKFAGVLSAYGMGLADITVIKEVAAETALTDKAIASLQVAVQQATESAMRQIVQQTPDAAGRSAPLVSVQADIRYAGTDFSLRVPSASTAQ